MSVLLLMRRSRREWQRSSLRGLNIRLNWRFLGRRGGLPFILTLCLHIWIFPTQKWCSLYPFQFQENSLYNLRRRPEDVED